jgi:hypothetical protein
MFDVGVYEMSATEKLVSKITDPFSEQKELAKRSREENSVPLVWNRKANKIDSV